MGLLPKRFEARQQVVARVPVDDDDGEKHCGSVRPTPAHSRRNKSPSLRSIPVRCAFNVDKPSYVPSIIRAGMSATVARKAEREPPAQDARCFVTKPAESKPSITA